MKLEISPGIEVKAITLRRSRHTKTVLIHLLDGRVIDLGGPGHAFTQEHFRTVMEADGIKVMKRPIMQWDNFCIFLMQRAKIGGGS